jgi:hypothetical protein
MPVWIRVWRKLETLTAIGLMAALNHNVRYVIEPRYGSSYSPSEGAHTNNELTEFGTACVSSRIDRLADNLC